MLERFAGFWIRVWATLIDSAVVVIPLTLIDMLLYTSLKEQDVSYFDYLLIEDFFITFEIMSSILLIVLSLLYYVYLTTKYGGTVGKLVLGLQVVNEQGEKISYMNSLGRFLGYYLSSILYIGYIMVGLTEKKQGLHDKLAKTYVVKTR